MKSNNDSSSFRFGLRDVLLADPALRRPHLAARQEQDVEAGVHPQHAQRRRRRCKEDYTNRVDHIGCKANFC